MCGIIFYDAILAVRVIATKTYFDIPADAEWNHIIPLTHMNCNKNVKTLREHAAYERYPFQMISSYYGKCLHMEWEAEGNGDIRNY